MNNSNFLIKNKLISKDNITFFGYARDNKKVKFYKDKIKKNYFY